MKNNTVIRTMNKYVPNNIRYIVYIFFQEI